MRLFCAYQIFFSPAFYFTLLFLSNISSKLLRIAQHVQSLPLLYLVLFSPTLFLPDIIVLSVGRFLLRGTETRLQILGLVVGALLAYVLKIMAFVYDAKALSHSRLSMLANIKQGGDLGRCRYSGWILP
jgi:hypothetical protein